jgi:uncharacterized protein (DUF362 family)
MDSNNTPVAVVKYDETSEALRKAIELANGFEELKRSDRVLLKPNVVWGGSEKVPQFGFVTTSRIVEDLLQLLCEYGCEISIGEGTVVNEELGSNTFRGFKWSGIERVAKKFGVKLIDFNKASSEQLELNDTKVRIAASALEADFLIDIPVLKTHAQTKVSLGLKNLKGCLQMRSKMEFHKKGLERMIALLSTKVKTKLTIIDGIYANERGPGRIGTAHRMNLIIAGRDILSCDIVGSTILGIDPSTVDHLREFAAITDRSLDIETIDVRGEKVEDVTRPLEWDLDYEDIFRQAGIHGITVQKPGKTVCTNCATNCEAIIHLFCKDNKGMDLKGVEVCVGAEVRPKEESKKVLLIGNCAIANNKDLKSAIRVKGCPIKISEFLMTFAKNALDKRRARRVLLVRFLKSLASKLGTYDEYFPTYGYYDPPEFDKAHF